MSVSGSLSLLLALLAEASAEGSWCVLVDLPFGGGAAQLSAEAAADFGIDLARLPLVPCAGKSWTTVVGALLDAFDVVAARPPARLPDGDLRRHIDGLMSHTAGEVMTPGPKKTVPPQMVASEALALMSDPPPMVTVLFVVEDGKPVGILRVHDLIQAGV